MSKRFGVVLVGTDENGVLAVARNNGSTVWTMPALGTVRFPVICSPNEEVRSMHANIREVVNHFTASPFLRFDTKPSSPPTRSLGRFFHKMWAPPNLNLNWAEI